jgi:hypothetical protein
VFSQQQGDITHISDSMPSQPLPSTPIELSKKPSPGPEPQLVSSPMDLGGVDERGDNDEESDRVKFIQPSTAPEGADIESMVSFF